jgi:transposase
MSGDITRVFVADTRRRWSDEQKRAIIEESKTVPVSRVAKRHGIAASLLFRWRKVEGLGGTGKRGAPRRLSANAFIPVAVAAPMARRGEVEIALASGARLIVSETTDLSLLKRVIAALS